jgi:prepilin-type N-terminal cleavage/methylation domain-containing protein
MGSSRRGFTVLELLVAVLVGGVVLLAAAATVQVLGHSSGMQLSAAVRQHQRLERESLLRDLVAMLEIDTGDSPAFTGLPHGARFTSWCQVPRGWLERCHVLLATVPLERGIAIMVETAPGYVTEIATAGESAELRFLVSARDGGIWLDRWEGGITIPYAIALLVDRDTIILPIGGRG